MRMLSNKQLLLALGLLLAFGFKNVKSEDFQNMFVKRCNNEVSKDILQQYEACDSEASDTLKETVKRCTKDVCNKDGKYNKPDVCCYASHPNEMFACFEKTVAQIENEEANGKGLSKEELHKKNSHNAAKIVECYEEIDDD